MRDKIKDEVYFNNLITNFYESIGRFNNWIEIGKTAPERIPIVKRSMVQSYVAIVQCKYASNKSIDQLNNDLVRAIDLTHESWDGFWLVNYNGVKLSQYGEGYDEMLWMLSLGYLLDIDNADFKKLVDVIDRDGVKDYLFEYIIRAKLSDRQPIEEESYQIFFGIPNTFDKLRQAITETDKVKAEKLVKEFVTKDWYKNHKDAGWYDSHKSKHDTYFGYWSFETAAVVKIMGLDDSSFQDCQYYPKDLVR